jgi:hypothetical protein
MLFRGLEGLIGPRGGAPSIVCRSQSRHQDLTIQVMEAGGVRSIFGWMGGPVLPQMVPFYGLWHGVCIVRIPEGMECRIQPW